MITSREEQKRRGWLEVLKNFFDVGRQVAKRFIASDMVDDIPANFFRRTFSGETFSPWQIEIFCSEMERGYWGYIKAYNTMNA